MELQEIKHNLKETRDKLLGILKGLSGEQLNERKDEDSWSIGQICQHLAKVEEIYVVAIKRGLQNTEESSTEHKSIDSLLDRKIKLEAPDIVKPTDERLEYGDIIAKLNSSRQQFVEMLNALEDPSILSRRHFVHPAFKEMLLIDWVKSTYVHEERHIQQIQDIINGGR